MKSKKKSVNEGIRNVSRGFQNEKELEETLKNEIAKEIHQTGQPKTTKK